MKHILHKYILLALVLLVCASMLLLAWRSFKVPSYNNMNYEILAQECGVLLSRHRDDQAISDLHNYKYIQSLKPISVLSSNNSILIQLRGRVGISCSFLPDSNEWVFTRTGDTDDRVIKVVKQITNDNNSDISGQNSN